MQNVIKKMGITLIITSVFLVGCTLDPIFESFKIVESKDFVHRHQLQEIRLGDGVPIALHLSVRWKVLDFDIFSEQFAKADSFSNDILHPRTLELVSTISNTFPSIDSIFSPHRQQYLAAVKRVLIDSLGEPGVSIKEIIVSRIEFPKSYTQAMEQVGLQRQELERIRHLNVADLERAEASKKKAAAEGEVAIERAESEGRLQEIKARTEKSRRASELAKAETESQVAKMKAVDEVDRITLLAKAELVKEEDLKNLDMERQRELEQIELDKQRQLDEIAYQRQVQQANLCAAKPAYASFLINKELAAKVEIAILPTGTDPNVFGNVINNMMPGVAKHPFK